MARLRILSTAQRIAVVVAAVFYIAAGSLHFSRPAPYLRITPSYIPWHPVMVRVVGAFEILGGLGLLLPATRRIAEWSLVALLIAVFPANLYMAMHPVEAGAASIAPVLRWGRLPLQLVLIWWLVWCTRPRNGGARVRRREPERTGPGNSHRDEGLAALNSGTSASRSVGMT